MIVKKPSIFIYTHLADEAILREVCAGVEEEGVFYEIGSAQYCRPFCLAGSAGFDARLRDRRQPKRRRLADARTFRRPLR